MPDGEEGEETDGITSAQRQVSASQIFTIGGQKATAMKKGIYVVNGKKVIK